MDLIVTSPPYPMVEMWDGVFAAQEKGVAAHLRAGAAREAFELMHSLLDRAWDACDRALRPGGIACVNIGDAVRTVDGDFQLFSNHSRVLRAFLERGYAVLPDILWRKQTNAPNKFMGSGMLPVGAYVTYEHEYILVMRKGRRRVFSGSTDTRRRRESAYFWEERNVWFSDVWSDIKGAPQVLVDEGARGRSAAFPFELAYRLISMFSVKGDVVLDPFAGTGTALAAALASARSAVGVELDPSLVDATARHLEAVPQYANAFIGDRLRAHVEFVRQRQRDGKPLKYRNEPYGFPVVTSQETDILLGDVARLTRKDPGTLVVEYSDIPQADIRSLDWSGAAGPALVRTRKPRGRVLRAGPAVETGQLELGLAQRPVPPSSDGVRTGCEGGA